MAADRLLDRLLLIAAKGHANHVLNRFLRATRNVPAVQDRKLRSKIAANAESAYGRDFGFRSIRTYDDFRRAVPISTYDDLAPYVRRVMNGDTAAMFGRGQRVLMFAMTSGSTAEPKYVPVTEPFLRDYRRGWNAFGVKALRDHPGTFLRPLVQVTSPMDERPSPCGIPCGAITGIMAATQKRLVRKYYVTPLCMAYVTDPAARYYTIMRLALPRDVAFMITANPATQLKLAKAADASAPALIRDIRDGMLDPGLTIPAVVRGQLTAALRPDPVAAARLESILARTGRLLPKDYWRLGFLANWTGGTMELYLRQFPEYFGNTPVRDIGLLASEGRMSIPLEDGSAGGVLDVLGNFYEFIPIEEADAASPTVLRAEELEIGRQYEIMLTTSAGFYRYNIGDVVRVVDFVGQAPVIEFLHKSGNTCSLTGEKLTERQALLAFEQASRGGLPYAATFVLAPRWADPPRYCLHVEAPVPEPAALARRMDAALAQVNLEYASKRHSDRLGSVEVNVLPEGWLTKRNADESASRRAVNEQYKPRYLYARPGEDAAFPQGRQALPERAGLAS